MQNKNTYYVAPLLTVVTSLKNNFATVRTSYLHIIAYLANTRSLMNGKHRLNIPDKTGSRR